MLINMDLFSISHRKTDMTNFNDIVIPLYQRQLGVLFSSQKQSMLSFEIYAKKTHDDSYRNLEVMPIYPDMQVPPLAELFDQESSNHDDDRCKLLSWMVLGNVSESSFIQKMRANPKNYLLDVLTVNLMADGIMSSDEADIFLYTFMNVAEEKIPKNIKHPQVLNEKAFRLVSAFMKLRVEVEASFEIAGLKRPTVSYKKSSN